MLRRLLRSRAALAAGAWSLGVYLDLALRSTRWTVVGREHLRRPEAGLPVVVAIWHQRLALLAALGWQVSERGLPVSALVSRHRDGRFIGDVLRRFGVVPVHGSSARGGRQKGGAAGLRLLVAALRSGRHVVITPDGPRGPAGRAAPGIVQLAALAEVPVLPVGAQVAWRIRLPTWDRMIVPLPFGRGVFVCGSPITVPRRDWAGAVDAVEEALRVASARADGVLGAC